MSLFIGCDLGGTNIKAGMVNTQEKKVILFKSIPTLGKEGPQAVMGRMANLINDLIEESGYSRDHIKGVGVSAPGLLDLDTGHTLFITNLTGHWKNIPLQETLTKSLKLPVCLLNDTRAITMGEYTYGAGRGANNMACYAIGTGIGGGIVINGELVLGISGQAGELGHMTIDINGPRCGCGNYGCVESFAAAPAIANYGVKAVQQGQTTKIGELADFDLNKITPKLIAKAAELGDEIANEIWENVGHYIGTAIANTIVSFNPTRIVISGGVSAAGELLLKPIRDTIHKRVFLVPLDTVEVVTGELGNQAGILGMAKWAELQQEKN